MNHLWTIPLPCPGRRVTAGPDRRRPSHRLVDYRVSTNACVRRRAVLLCEPSANCAVAAALAVANSAWPLRGVEACEVFEAVLRQPIGQEGAISPIVHLGHAMDTRHMSSMRVVWTGRRSCAPGNRTAHRSSRGRRNGPGRWLRAHTKRSRPPAHGRRDVAEM